MFNLKKLNACKQRTDWWLPGKGSGVEEIGEGGQRE